MARIDKINSLLIKELADLVNKEIFLSDGLITVSFVECSPDLRHAKAGFSVLPEKLSNTILKKLQRKNKVFSRVLKKKLSLKSIPRLNWVIDKLIYEESLIFK